MHTKYKQFRQYMADLDIDRNTCEIWTKEAIAEKVDKLVGQISIESLAIKVLKDYNFQAVLRERVGKELSKRISVSIKE